MSIKVLMTAWNLNEIYLSNYINFFIQQILTEYLVVKLKPESRIWGFVGVEVWEERRQLVAFMHLYFFIIWNGACCIQAWLRIIESLSINREFSSFSLWD